MTMVLQETIPLIGEVTKAFQSREELQILKEHQKIKSMIAGAYAEKEAELETLVAEMQARRDKAAAEATRGTTEAEFQAEKDDIEAEKTVTQARLKEYAAEVESLNTSKLMNKNEMVVAQNTLDALKVERKEMSPAARYAFGLYTHISHIEWDHHAAGLVKGRIIVKEKEVDGVKKSADTRSFSLDSSRSPYAITNCIWDLMWDLKTSL